MARSNIRTKLSLDDWATVLGISPLAFNGFSSSLFPNNVCGDIFFQYDYQNSDRIGRETIAQAINQAEMEMEEEAGFYLMPSWTTEERLDYPRPDIPGVFGIDGLNTRGMYKSVEAKHGLVISGGIVEKTLIQNAAAVVRTDADGDSYAETATVTVAVTFTNIDEVRIYYNAMDGDDAYEIRPATVTISGGFATIKFKSWQIPVLASLEMLDAEPLDAAVAGNYETTVDVYRVRNDPSTQVQFMWEYNDDLNCGGSGTPGEFATQAGCFLLRDPRLGIAVLTPGSWDATNSHFDSAEWSVDRDPDQVRLWYYSGWKDGTVKRPYVEMSNYWKFAVAVFAVSKFERAVCGCSNVNQFVEKWRRDAAFASMQEGGFRVTEEIMSNRLGTSLGAIYAYRQIHRNGIRIIK
jgi:hypothetical protein